jgi:drug/metabolite transporter (DMT)-like permease
MGIGILCGLLAAFFQSLAYLATRHYVQPRGGGSRQMLVLAHLWMAATSVLLLPIVWPAAWPAWQTWLPPLAITTFFYLLGQVGLVIALRFAEPSRISPLLGFKLVVVALLVTFLTADRLTAWQWVAVIMTIAGGAALNTTGGLAHRNAIFGVLLSATAYAFSDWNIKSLVDTLQHSGMATWRSFFLATVLVYLMCGLVALALLPRLGSRQKQDWLDAAPFAYSWLVAMVFLFSAFGLLGVLYGGMLQSTRGIMSVLMSTALAGLGLAHIEQKSTRKTFTLRLLAASVMLGAVVLYGWQQTVK